MAKGSRHRAMPSTPAQPAGTRAPADADAGAAGSPTPAHQPRTVAPRDQQTEADHLVVGTGCIGGHERGQELISSGIGRVPSKKAARVGFGLVLWCVGGLAVATAGQWLGLALQLMVVWLAFSALIQRRNGHRGKCWRTRTWRHAWGGLAPTARETTGSVDG